MYVKQQIDLDNEAMEFIRAGRIVYTTSNDRGVGKTRNIIGEAVAKEKYIVVSTKARRDDLQKVVEPLGIKVYAVEDLTVRGGVRLDTDLLVDDITERELQEILNNAIPSIEISGFVRVSS